MLIKSEDKAIWYLTLAVATILLGVYIIYMFTNIGNPINNFTQNYNNPIAQDIEKEQVKQLPIPPLLEDTNPADNIASFNLKVQEGTSKFIQGQEVKTYGYNGAFLGPVIRVKRGTKVKIKVINQLPEPTTVHWHGFKIPGSADGGPHQDILPNEEWNPTFTIDQPAATLWYHPHLLHKTGEQVYRGLAGLFYIEDKISESLNIPKDYGVNDIPLIIQDKRFTKDGRMTYNPTMRDIMHGFLGNKVLINGSLNPTLEVKTVKMRFRLLNGSNARTYQFSLNDNSQFYQIASDGGFLEKPVAMKKLILSPAERAEIIIDFSKYSVGKKIALMDDNMKLMDFKVLEKRKDNTKIPTQLTKIDKIPQSEAIKVRKFAFGGMGPSVNINGKQFNMDRIDEVMKLNTTEIWEISNNSMGMMGGMIHPFHPHGVQMQIIERNGQEPPANERGWKDTILVRSGEVVKAIVRLKQKGTFMYHCHILEHEDAGMMGQYLIK